MKRSTLILTLALALAGSATSVGFLQAAPKVVANAQTSRNTTAFGPFRSKERPLAM